MPELYPDLVLDYEAFWILNSTRTYGMSMPNPISMSEIKNFMDIFDINEFESKKNFVRRIKILDNAYLNAIHEKQKKNADK